ncbi:MAG: hypothetical protein HRT88_20345 [Lentisphaeraceae bacterium]|nr:hypothetical protein [Lentisphaeraceae bacterium]
MSAFAADTVDKDSEYYKVYQGALKIQETGTEGYSAIIKCAKAGEDVELSRAAVKVVILAMKKRGSKSIKTFAGAVLKKFPGEGMLDFLKEEPLATPCKRCKGTGKITARLKCRACGGKRYIRSKAAVVSELVKSLKDLIAVAPELARERGIYIGVGAQPQKGARRNPEDKDFMPKTDDEFALREILNYLKMQERRSSSDIYKKCTIEKIEGKWTLKIYAGRDFFKMSKSLREQTTDGFYKFWVLRAKSNGLGKDVNLQILSASRKIVGGNKGTDVWVK